MVVASAAPASVTVTPSRPMPSSRLTRPAMPAVRSSVPSNGTFAVSPVAMVTLFEVVSNS